MSLEEPQKQTPEQPNELLIKLRLEPGAKLSLRKVTLDSASEVSLGTEISGRLRNNLEIGKPLFFDNGSNISNVVGVEEIGGFYVIKTQTSTYEILNIKPEERTLTDFESFKTERGSIYKVLPDGRIQRYKTALNDSSYTGEDKGENPEREPSDIIIFINPNSSTSGWFTDVGASRGEKTVAESINIGIYRKEKDGSYVLVKSNVELPGEFVFIRVNKDDSFKLKPVLSASEISTFADRTRHPENRGLGVVLESGLRTGITNLPTRGYITFDYKYMGNKISTIHSGNKVTEVREK